MKNNAKKKLSIEKVTVAKISNSRAIKGGIGTQGSDPCDLTTRPPESIARLNCPSRGCDDIFQ